MATCVLISTTNSVQNGWTVYCVGTKAECEFVLDNEDVFKGVDIWSDTLRKNARIVSKTVARRVYGCFDDRDFLL